ncbi:hypothetical protein EP073_12470 [Geovibrio thiophilus]|uniref:Agl cluster protein AglQ n=1 Tax=Geovibrio thiophilus TaxID=139438 RepID=A0A410K1R6_9BACT|nr:hypothetical protein [Geovibrio thiophilus]QAR34188.1 hypothetical protein EP073_12470 [Geovibrio thiophilus]
MEIQNSDGSFPPGTNVYYNDPETPVRNTSHWLMILLKVYTYTNDDKYKIAAAKAVDYLLSKEVRPMGASFWCRKNPHKDFCNGTVGQAFTLDALAQAYEVLQMEAVKNLADEVFLLHPFDEKNALWRSVAVDGSYLPIDPTFNHQLWFAVAGAELWRVGKNEEIGRRVRLFLDALHRNMNVHKFGHKGLIYHYVSRHHSFRKKGIIPHLKTLKLLIGQQRKNEIIRAIRYHCFNLWAFPILKNVFSENDFWYSKKFKSTFNYIFSNDFTKHEESLGLKKPNSVYKFENINIYEAYTILAFCDIEDKEQIVEELLSTHFEQEYDSETDMVNRLAADKLTQAARVYEATRLPNLELKLKNLNIADRQEG